MVNCWQGVVRIGRPRNSAYRCNKHTWNFSCF